MRVAVASGGVEELNVKAELWRAEGIEALAVPTEVRQHGISLFAIQPGTVRTAIVES
jgi:NAD(P)-dependent dehydrogenase (short-subunit alcohol dehydrogenase family)